MSAEVSDTQLIRYMTTGKSQTQEPWLSGSHADVQPVQRAVLHALDLAWLDLQRWCGDFSHEELNTPPAADMAPVGFQLRHIARSCDRLLTYAEGQQLSRDQIAKMKSELDAGASEELFAELETELQRSAFRLRAFSAESLSQPRTVGRQQLPTTVAGLLVHVADHTQRHVGQAITTAKLVKASRART